MASPSGAFNDQQSNLADAASAAAKHPSQRAHQMEDAEKIQHLQQEINNLRSQIRKSNGGSLNGGTSAKSSSTSPAASSSSSALGMSSMSFPVLTVGLLLAVALVGLWRRRTTRGRGGAAYHRALFSSAGGNSSSGRAEEMTMTFELQDAHDYYVPQQEPEQPGGGVSYAAPSSAQVQFV